MNKQDFLHILQEEGFQTKEYNKYSRLAATSPKPFFAERKEWMDTRLTQAVAQLENTEAEEWNAVLSFATSRIKPEDMAAFACALANFPPHQWLDVLAVLPSYAYEYWPYLQGTHPLRQAWADMMDAPTGVIGEPLPANALEATSKYDLSVKREHIVQSAIKGLITSLTQDNKGSFCSYDGIVAMHRTILAECFPTIAGKDRQDLRLNICRFNSHYQDMQDPNINWAALRAEKPALSVFTDHTRVREEGAAALHTLRKKLYDNSGPRLAGMHLEKRKKIFAEAVGEAYLEFIRVHPFPDSNGTVLKTLITVLASHQGLEWDSKCSKETVPHSDAYILTYVASANDAEKKEAIAQMAGYIHSGLKEPEHYKRQQNALQRGWQR